MPPCEPIPEGTGAGPYTLKRQYVKDSSSSDGDDCGWVDYLQWDGDTKPPPAAEWEILSYTYACPIRLSLRAGSELAERDGDHCIAEYNGSSVLQRKYIYGPSVDEPICMTEEAGDYAGTYFYHFDALGSVVALTDADADDVQKYDYSVWGQVGAWDADHPNPYLFTGRRFDTETGLYYYRARYYHPEIGRFLQTDPIGYGDGMNWYRYCRNSPANGTDPFGREYWRDYINTAWGRSVKNGDTGVYFPQDPTGQNCAIISTANLYVACGKQQTLVDRMKKAKPDINWGSIDPFSYATTFIMDRFEERLKDHHPKEKFTHVEEVLDFKRGNVKVAALEDGRPDWYWGTTGLPDLSYVDAFIGDDMSYKLDAHLDSEGKADRDSINVEGMTTTLKKGPLMLALTTKEAGGDYTANPSAYHVAVVRWCEGAQSQIDGEWVNTPYEVIDPITGPLYFTEGEFMGILSLAANQMIVPR